MSGQSVKYDLSVKHLMLIPTFEIALAQCGVHFSQDGSVPFFDFKEMTESDIWCRMGNNAGFVHLRDHKMGIRWGVGHVKITELKGVVLETPKIVQFQPFGVGDTMLDELEYGMLRMRDRKIYELLILVDRDYSSAFSSSLHVEKYPVMIKDGEELKLSYYPGSCGIDEIHIWYSHMHGYTKAKVVQYGREKNFKSIFPHDQWFEVDYMGRPAIHAWESHEDFVRMITVVDSKIILISGKETIVDIEPGIRFEGLLQLKVNQGGHNGPYKVMRTGIDEIVITYVTKELDKTRPLVTKNGELYTYTMKFKLSELLHLYNLVHED